MHNTDLRRTQQPHLAQAFHTWPVEDLSQEEDPELEMLPRMAQLYPFAERYSFVQLHEVSKNDLLPIGLLPNGRAFKVAVISLHCAAFSRKPAPGDQLGTYSG